MTSPPRLVEHLLSGLAAQSTYRDAMLGDMAEEFAERATRDGKGAARRWYFVESLRLAPHLLVQSLKALRSRDYFALTCIVVLTVFLVAAIDYSASATVRAIGRALFGGADIGLLLFQRIGTGATRLLVVGGNAVIAGFIAAQLFRRAPLAAALSVALLWSIIGVSARKAIGNDDPDLLFAAALLAIFGGTAIGCLLRLQICRRDIARNGPHSSHIITVLALLASPLLLPSEANAQPAKQFPSDSYIRDILVDRIDTQKQGIGIVVGIIDSTGRRVISYGTTNKVDKRPVDSNTLFEIGSITKVFTSLLLADMVQRREVALDDAIGKILPANVTVPQRAGKQITLIDLSTHTSGLPRLPANLRPTNPADPYADYTVDQLYEFLSTYSLPRDVGSQFEYSNLGAGLLGHVLGKRAGMDYGELLRSRVLQPLQMSSSGVVLSAEALPRLADGHNATLVQVPHWELGALAGAGSIRSSANDMLNFVAASLELKPSPLRAALQMQFESRRSAGSTSDSIGMGWLITRSTSLGRTTHWHNGGTGGFRAMVAVDRARKMGVVVLSNASVPAGVDDIASHLLNPTTPLLQLKPRVEITVDQTLLQGYVGRYQLRPDFIITITRYGNHLAAQATGQGAFEMFAEGTKEFFARGLDIQATFETDTTGRATVLVLTEAGVTRKLPRI